MRWSADWGLACAAFAACAVQAADVVPAAPERAPANMWPSFRGTAAMTGASAGTLADRPALKWTKRLVGHEFDAGPALADGVAYFASMQGTVFALDLATGAERWRADLPADGMLKPGAKGNPLVIGKTLVVATDLGLVRCLDRATGKTVWDRPLDTGINSAPALVRGAALIGGDDGSIAKLDAATGERKWRVETGDKVFCSPGLVGERVLTSGCDGVIRLVAFADGKIEKEFPIREQHIAATPAMAGRHVYFGTMEGTFACLDAETLKLAWENPAPDGAKREFFSSPALSDDLAVVGARDRKLHAFDRRTGALKWSFAARGHIDSSPLVAGGRAYVGCEDRRFYAVELATGKQAWQHVCQGKVAASPALADGRLVFADQQGHVYCFGE